MLKYYVSYKSSVKVNKENLFSGNNIDNKVPRGHKEGWQGGRFFSRWHSLNSV